MPPLFLIRLAVALVWIYEGFWPKIMGRLPHQESVVESVPLFGSTYARPFLLALGCTECALGFWLLSGWHIWWAALASTVLLVGMNTCGLLWARQHIVDPGGMVVKNFTLIVLTWVAAGQSALA
jgi:uncharacterized membrane protein YphA (DoxX/SURF4 family)